MKLNPKLLLALILLLLQTAYTQQTVLVDATVEWQNTGITLLPNETVVFIGKGTWSNGGLDI